MTPLKISKISVHGLFDRFNHDINFKPGERIAIVIGPNGFGKTMMLRIVDAIFNLRFRRLEGLPFQRVDVEFDNRSILKVDRIRTEQLARRQRRRYAVRLEYANSGKQLDPFIPEQRVTEDDISIPMRSIEDFIPGVSQIGAREWINHRTGERLDLDDVIMDFSEYLPGEQGRVLELPDWLKELSQTIQVRFIDVDRLTGPPIYRTGAVRLYAGSNMGPNDDTPKRTVRRYSENLGRMVEQTLAEYAALSQSLDRTFPARLVGQPNTSTPSGNALACKLTEVEEKRFRVVEAGFMGQEEIEGLSQDVIDQADEPRRSVLAVYAQDTLKKLSVFDDLCARVDTLKRIVNSRLQNKQVSVSIDGLKVAALDGAELELEMLSSGEQHELVLLYDLLFEVDKGSLIMIDEPELSLHVAWQDEILNDLEQMADLSDFRVLLATHSPQIIGERWDLTIQLQGPETCLTFKGPST